MPAACALVSIPNYSTGVRAAYILVLCMSLRPIITLITTLLEKAAAPALPSAYVEIRWKLEITPRTCSENQTPGTGTRDDGHEGEVAERP